MLITHSLVDTGPIASPKPLCLSFLCVFCCCLYLALMFPPSLRLLLSPPRDGCHLCLFLSPISVLALFLSFFTSLHSQPLSSDGFFLPSSSKPRMGDRHCASYPCLKQELSALFLTSVAGEWPSSGPFPLESVALSGTAPHAVVENLHPVRSPGIISLSNLRVCTRVNSSQSWRPQKVCYSSLRFPFILP